MEKRDRFADLETLVNSYFNYCDAKNSETGEIVKPYTLSGLLCYVGITREEFVKLCSVKRHQKLLLSAKAKIEAFIEENALTGELSCNAASNSLKYNFGWGEKHEAETQTNRDIKVMLSPEMTSLAR